MTRLTHVSILLLGSATFFECALGAATIQRAAAQSSQKKNFVFSLQTHQRATFFAARFGFHQLVVHNASATPWTPPDEFTAWFEAASEDPSFPGRIDEDTILETIEQYQQARTDTSPRDPTEMELRRILGSDYPRRLIAVRQVLAKAPNGGLTLEDVTTPTPPEKKVNSIFPSYEVATQDRATDTLQPNSLHSAPEQRSAKRALQEYSRAAAEQFMTVGEPIVQRQRNLVVFGSAAGKHYTTSAKATNTLNQGGVHEVLNFIIATSPNLKKTLALFHPDHKGPKPTPEETLQIIRHLGEDLGALGVQRVHAPYEKQTYYSDEGTTLHFQFRPTLEELSPPRIIGYIADYIGQSTLHQMFREVMYQGAGRGKRDLRNTWKYFLRSLTLEPDGDTK